MSKEDLEKEVLHSNLSDEAKLEVIRCIEKAKENVSWNSLPHIKGKAFNQDDITYK